MTLEDYRKYYIQGSDHYLISKDEFVELFNEMINWKEESIELKQQQKEFIKYLQEEINVQIQEESIGCEITNKRYILEEILNKYKEITGIENDRD